MITIYTTPSCSYCKMAKGFFKSRGVEYTEIDVFADRIAREEMIARAGSMSVPVIKIDNTFIVGFNRSRIETLLGLGLENKINL